MFPVVFEHQIADRHNTFGTAANPRYNAHVTN